MRKPETAGISVVLPAMPAGAAGLPAGGALVGGDEQEGHGGAGVDGAAGQGEQVGGHRAGADQRVAPRVGGDQLGQQFDADTVRLARDRVDPQLRSAVPAVSALPAVSVLPAVPAVPAVPAHGRPPAAPARSGAPASGSGSTGARAARPHGPRSACCRRSAAKTRRALATMLAAPSGRWQAPRPRTRSSSSRVQRSTSPDGRANATWLMASARAGRPFVQGPHCPALWAAR